MKNTCEKCSSFDTSKHEKDLRTKHCGICVKFSEITFKNDKACSQFFLNSNPAELPLLVKSNNFVKQLELF